MGPQRWLAAVLILCFGAMIGAGVARGGMVSFFRGRTVVNESMVVERLESVAKLITTEAMVRDVVTYQNTWLGSTKRSLVIATGKSLVGFDLSAPPRITIRQRDRHITMVLPHARLLGVDITELRTYDEQRGLWNPFHPADRDTIYQLARRQLCGGGGSLGHHPCRGRARRFLTGLFAADGYTVEVTWYCHRLAICATTDGVADNIDRCPNTPAGTRVDATGCPVVQDSDNDGVVDSLDRCPNSPAGSLVDEHGCPRDTDHDGVPDNIDRCPNTPAGTAVDMNGCPLIADSDHDGVPDDRDRCPNSPAGRPVNSIGCTIIVLPTNSADQMVLRVQFVTNRSSLVPASTAILDSVAVAILASPGSRWEVQGYTDTRGTKRANQILSQSRAQAVVNYLADKGVPRGSMVATGFASERAVGSNATAEGQAANRRVQLRRLPASNPVPLP